MFQEARRKLAGPTMVETTGLTYRGVYETKERDSGRDGQRDIPGWTSHRHNSACPPSGPRREEQSPPITPP